MADADPRCRAHVFSLRWRCDLPVHSDGLCEQHLWAVPPATPVRTKRCQSFRAGHNPHPIQVRKGWEDPDSATWGLVTAVRRDLVTVWLEESRTATFRNHETPRLERLIADLGPWIRVQPRWSLLWTEDGPFSIVPWGNAVVPCAH